MATLEDELKDLREKNNELAQKVQYWKMTAAQKDDEKLALMKEINELRLKLSRLRNNGGFQARKLDAALQDASEKAISHLVKASAEIAKSMEIAKQYMRDRQELDAQSPRWSAIGGTPTTEKREKIHRVPPMMGGQSIQPVVALSRTMLNTSNPRSTTRSPNRNNISERAVPMHMLQDVYIPLTRIDIADLPTNNMDIDTDMEANNADDSTEEFPEEYVQHRLGGDEENVDSDDHISEGDEFEASKLEPVSEEDSSIRDIEPARLRLQIEDRQSEGSRDKQTNAARGSNPFDNPLEGPSWLLDDTPTSGTPVNTKRPHYSPRPNSARRNSTSGRVLKVLVAKMRLEGSPTKRARSPALNAPSPKGATDSRVISSPVVSFSPTVRRRKRTSSPAPHAPHTPVQRPHYSPRPNSARRNSTSGRVLKVLVAKMRLEGSPTKRARSPALNAPSPKGATDSRVIVSESSSLIKEAVEQAQIASRRESHSSQQGVSDRDASRARLSREYEDVRRVTSEHERRTQDGRERSV
uniref:Shugoshin C-terminal domain-containing protein n=1 Tax=Heliothis virescens TaxID=7102 RepID=A0A2A4JGZ7_HELVI